MLKRINWRAILYGFLWIVSLSGIIVLMSFIEVKKHEATCSELKILIPGNQNFVERAEIDRIIFTSNGQLLGQKLANINIHKLEKALSANPFIEMAKVYADMDGTIRVQIKQREPILRVLNLINRDFYIDKNGFKIPVSQNFTARVLVANGNIIETFSGNVDTLQTKIARDLFQTAKFIAADTLWNEQIEQLYVNTNSEIEMVPRVGNHKIILGNADSLEVKFANLLAFYKKALPKFGWDAYKTINIKYTNQVVCEKNIPDLPIEGQSIPDTIQSGTPLNKPDTIKLKQDTLKI